jgi:hypothetical protein
MQRPMLTRITESVLNPFVGKSVAMYFTKPHTVEAEATLRYSLASI